MIRRVWTAYTVEIFKAVRQKFTYLGPILVLLVVMCAPLQYDIERDGAGDFGFIADTTTVINLLGLLLVLSFCAGLVSAEQASGTIRQVLVRPLRRHEFLAAKLLTGMTYATILLALVGAASWTLALMLGDVTAVTFGDDVIYTGREMRNAYALGLLLALLPQSATVAYAVMISCLTRSTGAAVGGAVGIWIVTDMLKHRLGLAPLLFSSYLESPWQVFNDRCGGLDTSWFPMVQYTALASLGAFAVFTLTAAYALRRRSLQG